jgi:hypothetical protein
MSVAGASALQRRETLHKEAEPAVSLETPVPEGVLDLSTSVWESATCAFEWRRRHFPVGSRQSRLSNSDVAFRAKDVEIVQAKALLAAFRNGAVRR